MRIFNALLCRRHQSHSFFSGSACMRRVGGAHDTPNGRSTGGGRNNGAPLGAAGSAGARQVPVHASQMYSSNIVNFIEHFWNKDTMQLDLDSDDDILNGCLFIHNREVRNETVRNLMR